MGVENWTAIAGWKVTYHHPGGNYSGVCFVSTHAQLAREKAWMDAEGFSYNVVEVPKDAPIPADKSWAN
jgi:hypothetical protein